MPLAAAIAACGPDETPRTSEAPATDETAVARPALSDDVDAPAAWGHVTLRRLLAHLSGLPDIVRCDTLAEAEAVACRGGLPRLVERHDSLGEAYLAHGNVELARSEYERSLELNPGNENARGSWTICHPSNRSHQPLARTKSWFQIESIMEPLNER